MKPDYGDITERLGPPLWWDDHGAPRYAPFHPFYCDVYAHTVALMEIKCQQCGQRFIVAVSADDLTRHRFENLYPTPQDEGPFDYGDPPRHGDFENCPAGDTMSSIPIRILEFWEVNENHMWQRKHEYEIEFEVSEPEEA